MSSSKNKIILILNKIIFMRRFASYYCDGSNYNHDQMIYLFVNIREEIVDFEVEI